MNTTEVTKKDLVIGTVSIAVMGLLSAYFFDPAMMNLMYMSNSTFSGMMIELLTEHIWFLGFLMGTIGAFDEWAKMLISYQKRAVR